MKAVKKDLSPIYQKLWVQEQAIELGLLPDDAEPLTGEDFKEALRQYK